jgi:hypothetical protein
VGTLRPELRRVGHSESPVVIIDDFTGDLNHVLELAHELAPYPPHSNYYPGLRRIITRADKGANTYVEQTCRRAAQFIAGAFDIDRFELLEASFSIVTTAPAELSAPQRAPHFDTVDPEHLALLHYLNVPLGSGTAFYRQRSTGVERVTEANVDLFVRAAQSEGEKLPKDSGYILGSNDFFEEIGRIEAVPDRMVIYQGSLLHSGIIPEQMSFSPNPREGRLTANFFIRGRGQ